MGFMQVVAKLVVKKSEADKAKAPLSISVPPYRSIAHRSGAFTPGESGESGGFGKLSPSKPGGSQRGTKKQAREATGESSTLRTGVNPSMDNAGRMLDKGAFEKPYRPIASSIMVKMWL